MMTSLKTRRLLPLTILLVSITPTETEVVQSMSQCEGFLLENRCPQVPGILEKGQILHLNRYKVICQTYKDKRRFVTLYDTQNKIPVFSASHFSSKRRSLLEEERPKTPWKIEPQLESISSGKNMQNCNDHKTFTHQASNNDYKNNNFNCDRGHLFPSSYGSDADDQISTFTLTNVVPQVNTFNQGSWRKMEEYVKCILERYCKNKQGYVVTGAQPGNNTLRNRVNIPSVLWSAFCCYSHQNRKWIAGAFWGDNKADGLKPTNLQMKTLAALYDKMSAGNSRFEAFPGPKENRSKCPLQETAKESLRDRNVDATCRYPTRDFPNIFHKVENDDDI